VIGRFGLDIASFVHVVGGVDEKGEPIEAIGMFLNPLNCCNDWTSAPVFAPGNQAKAVLIAYQKSPASQFWRYLLGSFDLPACVWISYERISWPQVIPVKREPQLGHLLAGKLAKRNEVPLRVLHEIAHHHIQQGLELVNVLAGVIGEIVDLIDVVGRVLDLRRNHHLTLLHAIEGLLHLIEDCHKLS